MLQQDLILKSSKFSKPKPRTRFSPLINQTHFVGFTSVIVLLAIWLAKLKPLGSKIELPTVLTLSLIVLLLVLIASSPQNVKRRLPRLLLILILPAVSYAQGSNTSYNLQVYPELYGQTLELFATVQDDPAYNTYGDYEFNVENLSLAGDNSKIPGKIRVRTKSLVNVSRGDRIYVSGKLRPTLGSRVGSISYATIEQIASNNSGLEQIRHGFFSSVYTSLPEPHASLGIGFLAGVRSSITKEFQDDLSKVGLTHIVAVSGYNLTILVLAVDRLGSKKLSKFQKLIVSLSLIGLFMLFTGFAPSIVRASVVCLIASVCSFFGRRINPLNLILTSAAITAYINPVYLWQDLGWWLSFLAFFGVLILAPAAQNKIFKQKEPGLVSGIVIESFSAQLLTAPLIAHVFGTFSIISLLANVLVIPAVPLVMLLVFLLGLIGFVSPHFALLFSVLPRAILTVIVWIIENLAKLPWAQAQFKLSLAGMLISYLFIFWFIKISKHSRVNLSS